MTGHKEVKNRREKSKLKTGSTFEREFFSPLFVINCSVKLRIYTTCMFMVVCRLHTVQKRCMLQFLLHKDRAHLHDLCKSRRAKLIEKRFSNVGEVKPIFEKKKKHEEVGNRLDIYAFDILISLISLISQLREKI